jgi:hypothetical protein
MKTAATTATNPLHAAPRPRGFFARALYWLLGMDDITPEEARERMRNGRGFFASLTPEQMEIIRTYDGPENFGPPLTRRERRDLRWRDEVPAPAA